MTTTALELRHVRNLPTEVREHFISGLTPQELHFLQYEWSLFARDKQLPPTGNWVVWLLMSGRGFGKTRTGAEWVREMAFRYPGCRIALVGRTAADVRDVIVEGESGILNISPPWFRPVYQVSNRSLKWPNGSQATTYTAEEPDALRGP